MFSLSANAQSWTASEVAVGDFYLYNVGAGKFLNAGDRAAQWGTNATLSEGYGLEFALEANGDNFNLNSRNSNGGANNYLTTSLWTDGAATPWTFTAVSDKVYTISNGGQYLAANADGSDVEMVASSESANAQWKLVNRAGIIAAMASATKENPMNIRILIGASDFSRNDTRAQNGKSWSWTNAGGNVTVAGPNAQRGTYGCEFWNNTFDINQTLTGLPDGTYEFKISGYGTNGTTYIYGNNTEAVFVNQTSASNFPTALDNIADGQFTGNTTGQFVVTGGTLKIGVKRTQNKGGDWTVIDNADLIYYGLDLTDLENGLTQQIAAAEALNGKIPTAAYSALSNIVAANKTPEHTADAYQSAISAVSNAVTTAQALVASYSRYSTIKDAVLAISSNVDVTTADAAVEAATTTDAIDAAVATLRNALTSYLARAGIESQTIDLTAALIDNAAPGVSGNSNYWTNSDAPGLGNQLYEYYQKAGATSKQTITAQLPVGFYRFTVIGYTREGYDGFINAGENKQTLVGVSSGTVNNLNQGNTWIGQGNGVNEMVFQLTDATANLEIGITAGQTGDRWTAWRSFKLEYLGTAPLAIFQQQLADAATAANAHAAEAAIPAGIKGAYTNAISAAAAKNSTPTECLQSIADIEAATVAADAAAPVYAEYLSVKAQVEALKSVEGYTETTSGATNALIEAIAAADAAVDAATTTDAITAQIAPLKAAGKTFITSVRSDGAHPFDITFLITNPSFDNNDATGWTATPAPGFQSYTNCEYYFANTRTFDINQTLTDMPKGNYELKVQAFQRPGWFEAVYDAYKAGNNKVTSVIYINDGQTTIKNLVSEGATTSDAQWQNNNDSNKDGYYYANSMNGASKAFAAGYYWNTVLTAVEGDLKFGFKTTSESVDGDWTIFDNFRLYYYGQSINVAMDEAQAFSALADIEGANVTMARTTKEGYNTVALPFDLTEAQVKEVFGDGAEVYAYSENSTDVEDATVNFTKAATAIVANVPVLVKATKAAAEIKVDNVTVKTGEAKVEGTLLDFVGNYGGQITLPADVWFVGNGALYESTGNTTMKGFRAYIAAKSAEIKEQVGEVKLFIDGLATRVSEINGMAAENGVIYNVAGQRVNKAQKGIFIVNGKKVVK